MSDDIDIEEHDLLQNPRVLKIFPDLTLLKKEILDPYDKEQIGQNVVRAVDGNLKAALSETKNNAIVEFPVNIKSEIHSDEEESNYNNFNNRHTTAVTHFYTGNKIILGSKPVKSPDIKLESKIKIILNDIHNYLDRSDCYCAICEILFSKRHLLEQHVSLNHTLHLNKKQPEIFDNNVKTTTQVNEASVIEKNTKPQDVSSRKCFHCDLIFPSQMTLIEHLYDILESKNAKSQKIKPVVETKSYAIEEKCEISTSEVYQCVICSYYLKQQKFYDAHMRRKHKVKVKVKTSKVKFNPRCKYCPTYFNDVERYNAHLHKKHREIIMKIENISQFHNETSEINRVSEDNCNTDSDTDSSIVQIKNNVCNKASTLSEIKRNFDSLNFVNEPTAKISVALITKVEIFFKSVLFRCLKCDINFLSPNIATDHLGHNEMLVNWKCSLCSNFFKRNDEELHKQQHLYTNSFTVLSLETSDLDRILIKCINCAIYFNRTGFAYHLKHCENENVESSHCTTCDILIDNKLEIEHKLTHKNKGWNAKDFIIIDESANNTSTETNFVETKAKNCKRKNIDMKSSTSTKKLKVCEVISNYKQKKSNVSELDEESQSSSNNDDCMDTAYETSETDNEDLSTSLSFDGNTKVERYDWDLINKQIYPKINYKFKFQPSMLLNLIYCPHCKCFVSRYFKLHVHQEQRCTQILKRVCDICGLTITNKAVTSHKKFHKLNPKLKLQDFTFYDIETNEVILPPIPKFPQCNYCETYFMNKNEVKFHVCSEKKYLICDICNMKFTDATLRLHIPFHGYFLKGAKSREIKSQDIKKTVYTEMETKEANELENNSEELCAFICESCNVAVSTYDHLVEHCHSHYDNSYRNIKMKECKGCNLIFEHSSFEYHNNLHSRGHRKESLLTFTYDIFKFGCNNEDWIKHVFKDLPENKVEKIVKKAKYRHECRVKMDVRQRGSTELVLYQCVGCGIFIDNHTIYKHRESCKREYKKCPCQLCGIPLLSLFARRQHNLIHEKYPFITLKSFTIVLFNRRKDKSINNAISKNKNYYVLYQCRNCKGVVDWKIMNSHKCNMNDLKKCNLCGLMIYNGEYNTHVSRHKSLNNFNHNNMKVILFGDSVVVNSNERNDAACAFNGLVYDYTFYKCVKCNVCIRHLRPCSKHFCLIEAAKWKCIKCNLFFDEGTRKTHMALHATDKEFEKDTIGIIPFDPEEIYERLEKEFKNKHRPKAASSDIKERIAEKEQELVDNETVTVMNDTIYRCKCGLHHLTKDSANRHISSKKCSKNNLKQTCSKCNLNFTSITLYQHLLKHHGDKKVKYNIDVLDVSVPSENL